MRTLRQLAAAATLLALATTAAAHGGHGFDGNHWHATDVGGFLVVVVLATLAILFSRGK